MRRPVWHIAHTLPQHGRAGEPDAVWGIGYCAVQHCRYADRGWDGPTVSDRPPFLDVSSLNSAALRGAAFLFASAERGMAPPSPRFARSGQPVRLRTKLSENADGRRRLSRE